MVEKIYTQKKEETNLNLLLLTFTTTACGYRKFKHLKAIVILIKGLLNPIKAY